MAEEMPEETPETLESSPCPKCGFEGDWSGMHVTPGGLTCYVEKAPEADPLPGVDVGLPL